MRTGRLWMGASLGMALLLASYGLRAQESIGAPKSNGTPAPSGLPHSSLPHPNGANGHNGHNGENGHNGQHSEKHEKHEKHEEGGHEEAEHEEEGGGGLYFHADALLIKPRRRPHDYAILDSAADRTVGGQVQHFDWDARIGYRLGMGWKLEDGWEIGGVYTYVHSQDDVAVNRPTGGELFATLSAPITFDSADRAFGSSNLDLDLIDAELAKRWAACEDFWIRLSGGVRVATITQKTNIIYDFRPIGIGNSHVNSRIQFDGVGPRIGGEGFYKVWNNIGVWGRAHSSIMAGDFKTSLNQFVNDGRTSIVAVNDKFHKVVPVTEVAVGLGWRSDHLSLNVGYELQNFFGMVDVIDFPDQASYKNSYRQGDLSLEALTLSLGISY